MTDYIKEFPDEWIAFLHFYRATPSEFNDWDEEDKEMFRAEFEQFIRNLENKSEA